MRRVDCNQPGFTRRRHRRGAVCTNKEIAALLGVSQKTVMHHTVAIYQKIGVRGRSETVAWAIRAGFAVERG
jgi:DNA-binding NarL/FixJ family response regulator